MTERKPNILGELRRRRVFNTVALYIVGAWVALQVADLAFPGMDIPGSAIRYVWIGAFVLFPLVLIFGWRYDISRDGIRRTLPAGAEAGRAGTLRPPDRVYIGGLAAVAMAVVAVVLVRIGQVEPEILRAAPENSIAVLPFEVCEGRTADQAIAYQLSNEVLNRLAERNTLKVISRTTAYKLAGFGWGASRISSQIGVRYVLTGEVCRDGDALTLSAELRDQDDFIVVQDTYEQVVNPFEQIEVRVATQVADAVAVQLGDLAPFTADAPVNRLAYEQLLIGREFMQHRDWESAKECFERALELQPGYPEAFMLLAVMEMRLNRKEALVERLALARQKAGEALELARGEIERGAADFNAHYVIAKIQHTLAEWDQMALWREAINLDEAEIDRRKQAAHELFVESEKHLRIALSRNPSHTEAHGWLVDTIEHQGIERRAEALEMMQRALERDPLNEPWNTDVAFRLAGRGRYREAMELLDRFAGLPGGKSWDVWWTQLEIQGNLGRFDDKLGTMIGALKTNPDWGNSLHLFWLAPQMAELGVHDEAAEFYQLLLKIPLPEENWLTRLARDDWYPEAMGRGQEVARRWVKQYAGLSNAEILNLNDIIVGHVIKNFWVAGENGRAITLLESFLHHTQLTAMWAERQAGPGLWLAHMYLESDRPEDALPLLEAAIHYLEREVATGIRHTQTLEYLAVSHALLGNDEDALNALEMAVDYGLSAGSVSDPDHGDRGYLSDPFSGIRDDARFQALADRVEAIRAQQVSNIRALLARNDMEALLQPVIAHLQEKAVAQEG